MQIYIKPYKNTKIYKKKKILLSDIAEIAPANLKDISLEDILILEIKEDKKQNYHISIIDIIKAICEKYPDVNIVNVGEKDIMIEYLPDDKKENPLITFLKVVSVCLILFAGGGIAIMTFHTDSALPDVLIKLNEIFTGTKTDRPYWIEIPYSIGIAVGIIVFFNHFSSKKITDDPTPIEVEMDSYADSIEKCIINSFIEKKRGN
ncbi:MAG: stage V sporulation protein AA [Epulopiscium sp.]|nr:stage V sporulation protein AA [Candidatus Epulonipiscium sp.]HOQ17172.1 stage V sporulation protein AA [Defluviitaleaceae bacterium]